MKILKSEHNNEVNRVALAIMKTDYLQIFVEITQNDSKIVPIK